MEQGDCDEYVFSSSSAESIASGSNEEEVYTEEVIEGEEGSELVLLSGREVKVCRSIMIRINCVLNCVEGWL